MSVRTLKAVGEELEQIRQGLVGSNRPMVEQALRRPNQKPTRELYYAYLFAGGFGSAFGYSGMEIEMAAEYSEYDVRLILGMKRLPDPESCRLLLAILPWEPDLSPPFAEGCFWSA